jgi:hypothetical protein
MNIQGAVEIELVYGEDAKTQYIILPIHEFRNSGPVFAVSDDTSNGTHLLSAGDIRGSWNGWVADLIRHDQIVDTPPNGVEVY